MISEVDSLPKMLDLILMISYDVFLTSWTSAYESNVFYHLQDPMLALKINPIVELVAKYLYLVLLDQLGGVLYSKALIGWLLGDLFQNKES